MFVSHEPWASGIAAAAPRYQRDLVTPALRFVNGLCITTFTAGPVYQYHSKCSCLLSPSTANQPSTGHMRPRCPSPSPLFQKVYGETLQPVPPSFSEEHLRQRSHPVSMPKPPKGRIRPLSRSKSSLASTRFLSFVLYGHPGSTAIEGRVATSWASSCRRTILNGWCFLKQKGSCL